MRPTNNVKTITCPVIPIWVRATGTRVTRIKKARTYLRKHARIPTMPGGRQNALLVISCNLRLYHQLPVDLALVMIKEHFNPRINGAEGAILQYTDDEIMNQYRKAGFPEMYPTLGANDPKAKKKVVALALEKEVKTFLRKHTAPGGSCTPRTLLDAFVAFRCGVPINPIVFGRAIGKATGISRSTPFGVPTLNGFHLKRPSSKAKIAA